MGEDLAGRMDQAHLRYAEWSSSTQELPLSIYQLFIFLAAMDAHTHTTSPL